MPTLCEQALASLLNQLEEACERKAKALHDATSSSELVRKGAWLRFDDRVQDVLLVQEKLVAAWKAVKEERSANGAGVSP